MIFSKNKFRPGMLIAALLVAVAAFAFNTMAASAQCCGINIRNATECRFEVCLDLYSTERCLDILPGGNTYTIAECPNYRLVVHDACGVTHHLPMVPGTSINVRTRRGCCVRIYLASDCCWEVTPADSCAPCGP